MSITLAPTAVGGSQPISPITFDSWQGRPQKPKKVLSLATRLGGSKLIIQTMNTSSVQTSSLATKMFTGSTQATAIASGQTWIDSLSGLVGKSSKWTDENSQVINNVVIVDYVTTLSAKSGSATNPFGVLVTVQFTLVVDEQ